MASLFKRKRKDGSHVWYVTGYVNGKHFMQSTGTGDKKLALEVQRKIEEDNVRIKQGLKPQEHLCPTKLSEFMALYLEDRKQRNMSPNTIQTDRMALQHLLSFVGDELLTSITARLVKEFRDFRAKASKPASVNMALRHLKSAFSWALEGSPKIYLSVNPFRQKGLFLCDDGEKIPRCLTPSEKAAFFGIVKDPGHRQLFQFLLLTGCRRNEALDLIWQDIDLEHHQVIFRKTKSKRSRIVPIGLELLQVVMALDRAKSKPFPYNACHVSHLFKRYAREAELKEEVHLHCLRHTAASDLVRAGVHSMQIQKLLGHSSIRVTEAYVHVLPEDLRGAAEKLTCTG